MKILLTGFDPFDREKVNPAFEAVKLLPWIVFVLASVIFLLRSSKKAMSFSRPFWKFSLPIIIQIAPYFVNAYWDFLKGKCS